MQNIRNNKFKIILFAFFCAFITYFFGELSTQFALLISNSIIDFPIKDILNFALIFAFYKIIFAKIKIENQILYSNPFKNAFFGAFIIAAWLLITWFILAKFNFLEINVNLKKGWQFQIFIGSFLIIFHSSSEQLLLQKIIRPILNNNFTSFLAIILGALSFTFVQFLQSYSQPIYLINSFLIGIVFVIIGNKFGLWGGIFAHGFWSWFELIFLPNIFDFNLHGKNNFLIGNDSYGTYILSITGICLIFVLLLLQRFSYKAKHDTYKP